MSGDPTPPRFEFTVPVLIAGGGACGMVAALAARDQGAETLVIEQDAAPRGTTSMSQGLICAAGTNAQRRAGVEDSPGVFFDDIIAKTRGLTDPVLARTIADNAGACVDWLTDSHDVPFELDIRFRAAYGHSRARVHGWPGHGGVDLLPLLHARAEGAGADVMLGARLIQAFAGEDGAVVGVEIERPDGARERIGCQALVMAMGGFAANPAMVGRHMPEAAAAGYRAVAARFPDEPGGFIGAAQMLAATGRIAEAEDALRDVIARFPAAAPAYTAYAELAMHRQDWPEALARWTAAHQRFPDDKAFAQRIFDVRLNLAGEEGGAPAPAEAASADDDPRAALRDLVMQFESLGGRGIGCEFGMFQREFGAEPLGLLRWADMPYEGIVQALETRFAGVGLPENTSVFVNRENGRPEYCTRDLRGFMFMRAFVYEDEMPMERMAKQALRRLAYLKDKLIADLEAGSKIFVWRCTERDLTEAEIARLHQAVRSYGDNFLFYVRRQDDAHPNGTVEQAAPGLLIGYIDRFKMSPEGVLASAPASASWLELCRRAAEHARWKV